LVIFFFENQKRKAAMDQTPPTDRLTNGRRIGKMAIRLSAKRRGFLAKKESFHFAEIFRR
jgi:hypothetical protein